MLKEIAAALAAVLIAGSSLFGFSGCAGGRSLAMDSAIAARDGVSVTLDSARARRRTNPDRYEYAFRGTIENNSGTEVMKVIYTFSLRDRDGEEFRSFAEVYDGLDTPIPPHGSVPFELEGIKWGAQDLPASVAIGIASVQTADQLPPVRLPQPGDCLYQALNDERLAAIREEPPAELAFHVDQGGYGRTAVFAPGEALDRAVELLCAVTIREESGEWVTDNYNWIRLTWADGTESFISLNLGNLEYYVHGSPHTYRLDNLSPFWSYARDFLEAD